MASNDNVVYRVHEGSRKGRYVRLADGLVASCGSDESAGYVAGGATEIDPQDSNRMGNIILWSDLKKAAYRAAAE